MIRQFALVTLLILSIPFYLFAQTEPATIDYSKADTLALTVKYDGDIVKLTHQLTDPFHNDFLKARAIFRWVTDNIAYNYKFFNKYGYDSSGPGSFECRGDSAGCALKHQVWEMKYINKVLDKKKGVCQGYAMVFKKICDIAKIDCEFVPGYTRSEYYEIGTMGNLDHAWNVVRLNSEYYPLDATWAAGGCAKDDQGDLASFTKQFNEYYWLTDPRDFARNHFPEDAKWVLIKNYKKDNFSANPYYDPGVISGIRLLAPESGIIHVKRGDTLHFKIAYGATIAKLQINTNVFQNPEIWTEEYVTKHKTKKVLDTFAMKKQRYNNFKQTGDVCEFTYIVNENTLDYMDILFDYKRVMRFKTTYR